MRLEALFRAITVTLGSVTNAASSDVSQYVNPLIGTVNGGSERPE